MSERQSWVTEGFEAFRSGSFGNSGQNLYVSKGGVLQRIHQFDVTGNGYVDLIFCNSQNHWEQPPTLVYTDPLKSDHSMELFSRGAQTGALADLNGDGIDDLVLAFIKDGIHPHLNALVYYGSEEGITGRYYQELPAPKCRSAAIGDFKGSGKPAIAFLIAGGLRIFYQSEIGFEIKSYVDLPVDGDQLFTFDLDRDGCADLILRKEDGSITVFWGDKDGIDPAVSTELPKEVKPAAAEIDAPAGSLIEPSEEYVADVSPIPKVVIIENTPYVFSPSADTISLIPCTGRARFGEPVVLKVPRAFSAASGDINGS